MRMLRLQSPQPEHGPHVTRLWIAPGYTRLAAIFGDKHSDNWAVACWEDTTRDPVWSEDLFDFDENYPDPAFSPELGCVVSFGGYRRENYARLLIHACGLIPVQRFFAVAEQVRFSTLI